MFVRSIGLNSIIIVICIRIIILKVLIIVRRLTVERIIDKLLKEKVKLIFYIVLGFFFRCPVRFTET